MGLYLSTPDTSGLNASKALLQSSAPSILVSGVKQLPLGVGGVREGVEICDDDLLVEACLLLLPTALNKGNGCVSGGG